MLPWVSGTKKKTSKIWMLLSAHAKERSKDHFNLQTH